MNTLQLNTLKWWQTIKVNWVKYTTYKMNFFLTIIGPALVFFFVKYNLWSAIYQVKGAASLSGYTFDQMISYHIWAFVVTILAQGHASWNLSDDIRLGRISTYLIYPFNFWEFHTASFLSFQILQLFITAISLSLILFFGFLQQLPSLDLFLSGLFFSLYASLFWYITQYFTGILAFWLEETWIMRVMLSIVTNFLSGAIIPLDLYPSWLVQSLKLSPFPYLTYYPIQLFTGSAELSLKPFLILTFWMIFFILLIRFVWKKGMKLYTAAGM